MIEWMQQIFGKVHKYIGGIKQLDSANNYLKINHELKNAVIFQYI